MVPTPSHPYGADMTNLETEPTPLPPPTPAAAASHERRWARSNDRLVLGVAGGLGRALAIEPLFVRIAFVVLGLFSGVGILLYIAGLALLADSPTSPPPSTVRRIGGAVAVLLSMRWLFNGDARLPGAGWVVAIGLLGAAIALWRGRAPVEMRSAPPAADVRTDADGGSTSERWDALTAQRRDRPRPPRSALGLLTLGAATVVGALVWLLAGSANRGALAFGWATAVLGAGLLVGTFAGRARWLIAPALATATAAIAASALSFAGVGLAHRSGDRTEFVGAGSTVATEYRTGFGDFELVLTDYPGDVVTSVDVGVGHLKVIVPDNAEVQVDAAVGVGTIEALGSTRNGYRRTLSLDSNKDGTRMIKLKLRVGIGNLEVRRGSFADDPLVIVPTTTLGTDIPASQFFGDGTVLYVDGSIGFGDGGRIEADGSFQIPIVVQNPDGSVQLENNAVIRADGTVVSPGGFVIPRPDAPSSGPSLPALIPPGAATTSTLTAPTEVQP
jgi:phage shock protein PspC (stress-responsive transcriptional regulator)